jgi:Ni,Fe-hydrogenase I cytochrome b subunit
MNYIIITFIISIILLLIFVIYYKFYRKENNVNLVSNKLNKKNWLRTNPRLERKYPGRMPGLVFGNKLNMNHFNTKLI